MLFKSLNIQFLYDFDACVVNPVAFDDKQLLRHDKWNKTSEPTENKSGLFERKN